MTVSPSPAVEAIDPALAGERHQLHAARLAGLEAHRGAGGDVEPKAARRRPVESERRIGLGKVIVRADLDRPVAGVGDDQPEGFAAGVELDVAGWPLRFRRESWALLRAGC
jgi:hypothetical protein